MLVRALFLLWKEAADHRARQRSSRNYPQWPLTRHIPVRWFLCRLVNKWIGDR